MKKILITIFLSILGPMSLFATTPVITTPNWSSTLDDGRSVIITGTNFGTKPRPGPIVWAPFSNSSINPSAQGSSTTWSGTVQYSSYTASTMCYSGGCLQAAANWSKGASGSPFIQNVAILPEDLGYGSTIYYCYKRRSNAVWTSTDWNWKGDRAWFYDPTGLVKPDVYLAGQSDVAPPFAVGGQLNSYVETNPGDVCGNDSDNHFHPTHNKLFDDTWIFAERTMVYNSAAGNKDGKIIYTQNGSQTDSLTHWRPDCAANPGRPIYVNFQLSISNTSPPTEPYEYTDEIYLDTTLAAVWVSTGSTDGLTGHKWMQPCTAYADTSITFTFNQSNLPTTQRIYLYVRNALGEVSAGYSMTVGATDPTSSGGGSSPPASCNCP